jgi:nitrogen fixation NifU-like protein
VWAVSWAFSSSETEGGQRPGSEDLAMFDRQMFIDYINDHAQNPHHYGRAENATVSLKFGNPGCGDLISVYLTIDDQERITDVSFVDENPNAENPNSSCTLSRGATSILTDQIIGRTLSEIHDMDYSDFADELGGEMIVRTRPKCATLGLSAVKAAERHYRFLKEGTAPRDDD